MKLCLIIFMLFSSGAFAAETKAQIKLNLMEVISEKSALQTALDNCKAEKPHDEKREVYFFGGGLALGVVLGILVGK